jgi:MoxR-like ATPase
MTATNGKTVTAKTVSEKTAADITALLRARNPLIWVKTGEEGRVEGYLFNAAAAAGYVPRTWDCGQGVADIAGTVDNAIGGLDIGDTLKAISERAKAIGGGERGVWIMRDLPGWIAGPGGIATLRQLRNLARLLPGSPRDSAQALIVLSPSGDIPPELANHATVVEWPLPDRNEIAAILDIAVENNADAIKGLRDSMKNGTREAAIDAAVGLTGEEAHACYSKSLVQFRRIDPAAIAAEKKRVIAREGVLEWFDPLPGGLDSVGGLEGLKAWLKSRSSAYSPKARAYGLPAPKGAMLVGVMGCGKSLIAKAMATAWSVPLLKMDLGALKSKFVGESEGNLRKALRVVESVGRCVLWLDEIEKALAGATQGAADGGVSSDALGTILSWMQDRKCEAFVIATANKVEDLPPELLRKGRFDELFFVDLPNEGEREAVLMATLRKYDRGNVKVNLNAVAKATDTFTGSEVAEIVTDAMFAAFADDAREITTDDLIAAARTVTPLSKTASEKISRLRDWAKGRARPATLAVAPATAARQQGRALDI